MVIMFYFLVNFHFTSMTFGNKYVEFYAIFKCIKACFHTSIFFKCVFLFFLVFSLKVVYNDSKIEISMNHTPEFYSSSIEALSRETIY